MIECPVCGIQWDSHDEAARKCIRCREANQKSANERANKGHPVAQGQRRALTSRCKLRRRPRTKRIGEYDVPLPVREALEYGRRYWLADPIHMDLSMESAWRNRGVDTTRLFRGLIHLDPESAAIHGKALASLMSAEGVELIQEDEG